MQNKTVVILVNTGSPSAPTAAALKPYLRDFLSDPRIIELPRWFWLPILNGIILRKRPAQSAQRYQKIWMPEGSPLIVHTERLTHKLNARFDESVRVDYAMRVGYPSVDKVIEKWQEKGVEDFIIFPMFAQYATQTVESVMDAVRDWEKRTKKPFRYKVIEPFYNQSGFIQALAQLVRIHRSHPDTHLVMSFHGIPVKSIRRGSPYEKQCLETAQRLSIALGLKEGQYSIAYQSRFGGDRWLQPYLSEHVLELLKKNVRSIDVVCLSFSVDCLETLEEIGLELKELFLSAGGQTFRCLPCLNDDDHAVDFYEQLIRRRLLT